MAAPPQTNSSHDAHSAIPAPTDPSHLSRGYGAGAFPEHSRLPYSNTGAMDFAATQGAPVETSPLAMSDHPTHPGPSKEDFSTGRHNSSRTMIDGNAGGDISRTNSTMSQSQTLTPSRGGTLKKKASISKRASVKRSGSRKASGPGSVRLSYAGKETFPGVDGDEINSAFFVPVPTTGNPTDILVNRFQAWRKVLKDLIAYFRDVQKSSESRSKSLLTVSNLISNIGTPPIFLKEGGIGDATQILRDYHKQALAEGNKARDIENDVIIQLTGLRSDLSQKCKEIKGLAGDFKNTVDKETEGTRKAVRDLQEALGLVDAEPSATVGKGDPFIVRLRVERQVEKQIDEENYLHRAFLNLENSGRELESIVVGEIQKAYNAYAGILKREADEAYDSVERLRSGPIAMPKDREWHSFVYENEQFVDPRIPVRRAQNIHYPGKDNPAAAEVRSGMLERKSKYLKSYTPGWYVLSPTHLHEFKSADHISAQQPIMSLYLSEQKLGSRSTVNSSSHKFMLKGRQTGGMHRGHAWVFRAESYDTMMAWYEDIKNLTEKTGEERNAFVRRHARSFSSGSHKAGSVSSDGVMDEDEADEVPFSANTSQVQQPVPQQDTPARPQPGGRFPSDIQVNRFLQAPLSPSSATSSGDRDPLMAAGTQPESSAPRGPGDPDEHQREDQIHGRETLHPLVTMHGPHERQQHHHQTGLTGQVHQPDPSKGNGYDRHDITSNEKRSLRQQQAEIPIRSPPTELVRRDTDYATWMAPGAAGNEVADASTVRTEFNYHRRLEDEGVKQHENNHTSKFPATTEAIGTSTNPPVLRGHLPDGQSSGNAYTIPASRPRQIRNIGTGLSPQVESKRNQSTTNHAGAWNLGPGGEAIPESISPAGEQLRQPQMRDKESPFEEPLVVRPSVDSHKSVQTISDLHVPGEFPPTPVT